MEKLHFTVDSALLSELGEKLVETVHLALVELVKNSYDADASSVTIKFTNDSKGNPEVHIIDNGTGMNFDAVQNYWMHIATTNKVQNNISPIYGRPKTGSKGIGRFCCRRLGKQLELITTGKKGNEYQTTNVIFNWTEFEAGTDVTTIPCDGKKTTSKKGITGTTLIIKDIEEEWNTTGYNFLKRQLAILVANRGIHREGYEPDPGFNIYLHVPAFEDKEVTDLREAFFNAGWGTVTASINEKSQAVYELHAKGIGEKIFTTDQTFSYLGDVTLKIGIFVQDKKDMRNPRVLAQWNLSEILKDWGGIHVKLALRRFMWVDFSPRVLLQPCLARLFCI